MPFFTRNGANTPVASAAGIQATTPNVASLFGKETVKLANGGWVTAAIEDNGTVSYTYVRVNVYDSSGTLTSTYKLQNYTRSITQDVAVTALANGGHAVVFAQGELTSRGIFLSTSGTASSGVRTGLQYEMGMSPDFDIATLANGDIVVTSTYREPTASGTNDIYSQRFSATGAALAPPTVVNSITTGAQFHSSVTALAGGGYVITWGDSGSGASADTDGAVLGQLFDSAGNKVGGSFLVNTITDGSQLRPSLAALADGGFIAAWINNGSDTVAVQVFDASGAKVGAEFTASLDASGAPQIDVLPSGEVVIGWNTPTGVVTQSFLPVSGSAPGDLELSSLQVSETGAENVAVAAFSVVNPINLPASAGLSYAILSDSSGGAFALVGDQLVVVDRGKLDSGTPTVNVTVRVTDGNGASYDEAFALTVADSPVELVVEAGPEILVNTTASGAQFDPAIARLGAGWVSTWTDSSATGGDTSGTAVRGQIFDSSGAKLGGEFLVNGQTSGSQTESSVTALSSGNFIAIWTSGFPSGDGSQSGIRGQLFNSSGAKLGTDFIVNTSTGGTQLEAVITPLANGGFVATWADEAGSIAYYMKGQVFDASGAKTGPEFQVNSSQGAARISGSVSALSEGGFVIAWEGAGGFVAAQRFSAAGEKTGGQFTVSTAAAEALPPAVAGLPGNAFVVTWTQGSDIYARSYGADGGALGQPFLVNTTVTGVQNSPAIAALDGGLIVIAWADTSAFGADGGGGNIRAQIFTANGLKVGDEFVVNTAPGGAMPYEFGRDSSEGHASAVSIAATNDGFVVSWASDAAGAAGDGSGRSVKARSFSLADFAQDDAATGTEGTVLNIAVQSNDTPPAPGISMINGVLVQPGQAVKLPSGAVLTVNNDGTLSYDDRGVFGDLVSPARAAAAGAVNGSATDSFSYRLAAGGAATVSVTVNGTDEADDFLIFGAGDDTYRSSAASELMDGRDGNDRFLLQDGGEDYALGGLGDDAFYFGAALSQGDFVDGGAGSDQVGIHGNYGSLTLDASRFAGIETFVILAGNDSSFGGPAGTYSYNIATQGSFGRNMIVNMNGLQAGESVSFNASAELTGGFTFFGSLGTENLTGGANDDGFFFGEGRFGSADRVDGGGGSDNQIGVRGDYTIDFGQGAYASTLTNIQTLVLISAQDPRYLAGGDGEFDYSITLGDGLVSGTSRFTVNGNGLSADEAMVVDGSGETTGTLRLIGGAAGDTLIGGGAGDTLYGGGGNDRLFGGMGADNLTGSGGADTFIYTAAAQSSWFVMDTINQFSAEDVFDLSGIDANSLQEGDQAFTFVNGGFTNSPGQLRITQMTPTAYRIQGDVDGDGFADLLIHVETSGYIANPDDFIL